MGTEGVWIPALIAAVGAGASAYNTRQTAKEQDSALARQLRGQAERQRGADAKVSEIIAKQAASTPDDERLTASSNYLQALKQAKGKATGGLAQISGASDAFKQATVGAEQGIGDYGQRIASLLSSIDAPYMQRMNEGLTINRDAGELGLLERFDQGANWLDDLRLRGIRRNPWIDAAGSALQGYGGAMASGGGGSVDNSFGAFGPGGGNWNPRFRPGGP